MALALHDRHSTVVPATILTPASFYNTSNISPDKNIATVDDSPHYTKEESSQITRRSLSLLSRSSLRLLSQCSSLDSLPSLGLSFHGSSSEHLLLKGDCVLEIEYHCAATLQRQGEQVLCGANDVLYSASSCSQTGMRASFKLELMRMESNNHMCSTSNHGSCVIKEGPVRAMAVMGDWLFSSHEDYKIRVWARAALKEKAAHKMIAVIPTLWDSVTRAMVPGAYVKVRRNQRKSLWIQHVDAISALAVSQSKGLLYSASWDRSVKVWRLPDFKCMESFRAHDDAVNALVVFDDGGFLYTGSADSKIKVWARLQMEKNKKERQKHMLVATLGAHRSAVNALVLSPDRSLLYSGACDKAIVVWERGAAGTHHAILAGALRGHRQAVLCLVAVGTTLCSGSADKTIRVWHRVAGRLHTCVAILEGHSGPVKSLSNIEPSSVECSPLHPYTSSTQFSLYSASLDQDVKLWSIKLTLSAAPNSSSDDIVAERALLQGSQCNSSLP